MQPEQNIKSHCSEDDGWLDDDLSILTAAFYVVSELWGHAMPGLALTDQFIE